MQVTLADEFFRVSIGLASFCLNLLCILIYLISIYIDSTSYKNIMIMYLSDADLLGFLALFVREVFLLRDLSHWTVCRSDLNKIQKNKLAI